MMATKSFIFRFADIEVREREFSIIRAGETLSVEPKAFRVLLLLLRNPGKLIPKQEILDAVWGDAAVTENSLTRSVALLRKVLGDEAHTPRFIETVATVGYRFSGKVEAVEDPAGISALVQPGDGERAADPPPRPLPEPPRRRFAGKALLAAVAAVLLLAVLAVWYLVFPRTPRVTNYVKLTSDGHMKELVGTDGSRLYFNRDDELPHIAQVATTGGDSLPIQVGLPNAWLLNVLSDGSALLVLSDEEGKESLWSVQNPGGSLRPVIKGETISNAAWSPDGRSVVYATDSGDLYVIASDGSNRRLLVDEKRSIYKFDPVWSPDGGKIRFVGNNRLWEVSADGSGLHELFKKWRPSAQLCCGRWSPDGNFYYFLEMDPHSAMRRLLGLQFWVSAETRTPFGRSPSEPKQLTSGPLRWTTPVPGKDGKTIFARGVLLHGELVRLDSNSRSFKPWLSGISAEFVTFSPDGKSVAYVSFPEGILWRANRDGSNPVQLTSPPLYPVNPRWSPDGTQILFPDLAVGANRIYSIGAQGGGVAKPLLPESAENQGDAAWSPDGRRIVFDSFFPVSIKILDLDNQKIEIVPGSEGLYSSLWSPDGRYLAALNAQNNESISVFDFQTQRWTKLQKPQPSVWFNYPTWSSNSRFIYFERGGTDPAVCRIPVSGGPAERIADLRGFHHTGAVTIWFGLDPQDTPMLLRDVGSDEIYALTLEPK